MSPFDCVFVHLQVLFSLSKALFRQCNVCLVSLRQLCESVESQGKPTTN